MENTCVALLRGFIDLREGYIILNLTFIKVMSEIALELIAEAKQTRAKSLDLAGCGIEEIPEELFELTWLEELNFNVVFDSVFSNDRFFEKDSDVDDFFDNYAHIEGHSVTAIKNIPVGFQKLRNLKFLIFNMSDVENDLDITNLKLCKKLVWLDLSESSVKNIDVLKNMPHLKKVDLSTTQISDISCFKNSKNLSFLSISNTEIHSIPDLSNLKKLETLYISYTKVKDYSEIQNISSLKYLSVRQISTNDFSFLSKLENLLSLDIGSNEVLSFDFLDKMKNLSILYLTNVRSTDFSKLKLSKNLKSLTLSFISTINLLSIIDILPLLNLEHLTMRFCGFSNIPHFIYEMKSLKSLDLGEQTDRLIYSDHNYNEISIIDSRILELSQLKKITIDEDLITNIPQNILEEGITGIRKFFQQSQDGTEPLYEARVLIVGEGASGKTSLLKKLENPNYKVEPNKLKETLGIKISDDWKFPWTKDKNIEFTSYLWDFGGQEIQYMTHQFFLSSEAVYVIVADDRAENTRFDYWFDAINTFGRDEKGRRSPVLVVLNRKKTNNSVFNYDGKTYQENYKEIAISELKVNLADEDNTRLEAIAKEIQRLLSDLPHIGFELPKAWRPIRESLISISSDKDKDKDGKEQEPENYINWSRFQEICQAEGVEEEGYQTQISDYLHKLGNIIYFREQTQLSDFIILNPEWALKAIYTLLLHKDMNTTKGRFNEKDIDDRWQGYSKPEKANLLSLMKEKRFDLVYEVPDMPGNYIAPVLLDTTQPTYEWNNVEALRFRYSYAFMPKGIITRLIVRKSAYIEQQDGEYLVWKNGVVLSYENCRIKIIQNEYLKRINIEIIGESNYQKGALAWVLGEAKAIHDRWYKNVPIMEEIPCTCELCRVQNDSADKEFYDYKVLLRRFFKDPTDSERCRKSDEKVPTEKLLTGVLSHRDIMNRQGSEMHFSATPGERRGFPQVIVNVPSPPAAPVAPPPVVAPVVKKNFLENWWVGYLGSAIGAGIAGGILIWLFTGLAAFKYGYLIFCVVAGVLFIKGNPEKILLYSGLSLISMAAVMSQMNFDFLFHKAGESYDLKVEMVNDYGYVLFALIGVFLVFLWWRKPDKS